jgi:hypothetical protein
MNADEIVRALRKVQEDYKNDIVSTGRVSISDMARDCANMIESLQAQLAASQARERAAEEDMKNIVDAVREAHCDGTCCFACKYDADFSIGESGNYLNECPGFDRDDCFEWRGPQAGEVEP